MRIKNLDLKVFLAFISSLFLMLAARDLGGVYINQYLIIIYIAAYMFIVKYKYVVYSTAVVLPLLMGVNQFTILVPLFFLFFKAKKINSCQVVFPVVLIFLEFILEVFVAQCKLYDLSQYALYIFMFSYLLFDENEGYDYGEVIKYFVLSTAFVSLIIVLYSIQTYGIISILSGAIRIGAVNSDIAMGFGMLTDIDETSTHFSVNPNTLAYFSISGISLLLIGKEKLKINNLLYLLSFASLLIAGALTVSRTWMLCLVLLFALYFQKKIRENFAFLLLALTIILVFLFVFKDSIIAELFSSRMDNGNVATGGGRTEIFSKYMNFLLNNPIHLLFGCSVIHYRDVAHIVNSVHCGLQQILVCYGCLGMLIFLVMAYQFKKRFYSYRGRKPFLYLLPFLIILLFDQSIQFLNPHYLMVPFIFACYALRLSKLEASR